MNQEQIKEKAAYFKKYEAEYKQLKNSFLEGKIGTIDFKIEVKSHFKELTKNLRK